MSAPREKLPAATARLFDGYADEDLLRPEHRDFLLERLLEEGDREDLRWLSARVGEKALRDFVDQQGARRLSARSRAFWRLVLFGEPATVTIPDTVTGSEIWPLA